jgi:hypothetical protein
MGDRISRISKARLTVASAVINTGNYLVPVASSI